MIGCFLLLGAGRPSLPNTMATGDGYYVGGRGDGGCGEVMMVLVVAVMVMEVVVLVVIENNGGS